MLTVRIDYPDSPAMASRNNPVKPPIVRGVRETVKALGLVVLKLDDYNTIVCDRAIDNGCYYGWSNFDRSFVMVEVQ